ncbi:MAG: hypothetical protein ABIA67_05830, partial [Candidatus Margulisiibacteriota bacterium]
MKLVVVLLEAKKPLNTPFAPVLHMSGRNPGLAQRIGHYGDASSTVKVRQIRETQGRHFQPRYLQVAEIKKPDGGAKSSKVKKLKTFSLKDVIPISFLKQTITDKLSIDKAPKEKEEALIKKKQSILVRNILTTTRAAVALIVTFVLGVIGVGCATTGSAVNGSNSLKPGVAVSEQKTEENLLYAKEFNFKQGVTTVAEVERGLAERGLNFIKSVDGRGAIIVTEKLGNQNGPYLFLFIDSKIAASDLISIALEQEGITNFINPTTLFIKANWFYIADGFKLLRGYVYGKGVFGIDLSKVVERE